jgi:hypothetical protein
MKLDGQLVRPTWLAPEKQTQVGVEAYDQGAQIISSFFRAELAQFLTDDLDPLGRAIIEVVLKDGDVTDFEALTPLHL